MGNWVFFHLSHRGAAWSRLAGGVGFAPIIVLILGLTSVGEAMPGVDLKGLDPDDVDALETLMKEGACPCKPADTLFECLKAKSCPAATALANFGADQLREGLTEDQLREAVVKRYLSEHITYRFDLSHAAKRGGDDAKIKLVEFADFGCPHCATLSAVLDGVVDDYAGQVTLYFKHFPLPGHKRSEPAARAAFAAGLQGKFWEMHHKLFATWPKHSDADLIEYAKKLGLDVDRFKADFASPAAAEHVNRDLKEALAADISGTPSLFVNGHMYFGERTKVGIKADIDAALKALKKAPRDKSKPKR